VDHLLEHGQRSRSGMWSTTCGTCPAIRRVTCCSTWRGGLRVRGRRRLPGLHRPDRPARRRLRAAHRRIREQVLTLPPRRCCTPATAPRRRSGTNARRTPSSSRTTAADSRERAHGGLRIRRRANLQALLDRFAATMRRPHRPRRQRPRRCRALQRAQRRACRRCTLPVRGRSADDVARIRSRAGRHGIELIALAGYLRLVPARSRRRSAAAS
jgi:hypothetical protein